MTMQDQDANQPDQQPELPTEVEQLQRELDQWKDLAARRLADLENMRRRTALEKQELHLRAAEHVITKMLPVLDDLHAAAEAAATTQDAAALKTGIDMIFAKARQIFEEAGVRIVEAEPGQPFNVDMHESLMHAPSEEHPEGHIIQPVMRGYQLNERVLRHAKVITSAGLPPHSQTEA
ncbi:MAG: nucleotide exchange factor GrpE [Bacteroidota bacterium]